MSTEQLEKLRDKILSLPPADKFRMAAELLAAHRNELALSVARQAVSDLEVLCLKERIR